MFGDAAEWARGLRSFDERFLERVVSVWQQCLAELCAQPLEDDITMKLVKVLRKDAEIASEFYLIAYQHVPLEELVGGTVKSLGAVDMAVILSQDQDIYLAYECKRLNVVYDGGRQSLASRYVRCGLMRFVENRYSQNLPVGCMLGYVMDGDMAFATSKVQSRIVELAGDVGLMQEPQAEAAVGEAARFRTEHQRVGGGPIEVRHALLPVRDDVPGEAAS